MFVSLYSEGSNYVNNSYKFDLSKKAYIIERINYEPNHILSLLR